MRLIRPSADVAHAALRALKSVALVDGYQTSSIEETQIASFQAGMLNKDPVFGLLFMLAQFHVGVQITPITAAERGVAVPELMMAAFVRGTQVNRDMCVDWVPQRDFDRTLTELRERTTSSRARGLRVAVQALDVDRR